MFIYYFPSAFVNQMHLLDILIALFVCFMKKKNIKGEKMEVRSYTICYFSFLDLLLVCADHETWLHLHKLPPFCRGAYDLSERGFLQF